MEDFGQTPAPCQSQRRWLLSGGIALALMLSLGVGALLMVSPGASRVQAASIAAISRSGNGRLIAFHTGRGQCSSEMTVSRVSGRIITVTKSDGSTVTVRVGSHTHYTRFGQTVTESAVVVGSRIIVNGSCTTQGRSINATSIEIVS